MKVIKIQKEGKHLNPLEKYHIYKTSKDGLQMNDTYINNHNPIFKVIQELNNRYQHKHIIKERISLTQQTFENKIHSIK
jgi:hypothetical protein